MSVTFQETYDMHKQLKAAYGLDYLHFYSTHRMYHCRFTKRPEDVIDGIFATELDYLLKILTIGQGIVYFDDVGIQCNGMDELKQQYLIFTLAGL